MKETNLLVNDNQRLNDEIRKKVLHEVLAELLGLQDSSLDINGKVPEKYHDTIWEIKPFHDVLRKHGFIYERDKNARLFDDITEAWGVALAEVLDYIVNSGLFYITIK